MSKSLSSCIYSIRSWSLLTITLLSLSMVNPIEAIPQVEHHKTLEDHHLLKQTETESSRQFESVNEDDSILAGNDETSEFIDITTDLGVIRGLNKQTYNLFLDIPYGMDTSGEHRWKNPRPVPAWGIPNNPNNPDNPDNPDKLNNLF